MLLFFLNVCSLQLYSERGTIIRHLSYVWQQSLLYKKPGSAFPFFTKIPATPKHVLSGDSGIEDGGVDGIYTRSMLTESGDNKPCCTQATIGKLQQKYYDTKTTQCSQQVHAIMLVGLNLNGDDKVG